MRPIYKYSSESLQFLRQIYSTSEDGQDDVCI